MMTDHSSDEGSAVQLQKAVEIITGAPPVLVDARHFMPGGHGRVGGSGGWQLRVARKGIAVTPRALIIYEIRPADRPRLAAFQRQVPPGVVSLGADARAWRNATDKRRTVDCFRRDGIAQMETISLPGRWSGPDQAAALQAFEHLGSNVWARPAVGLNGADVFHLTSRDQLQAAHLHYAGSGQDWLISRDADNFTGDGRRHKLRMLVLGDRVLRVQEHVQDDPDLPCNMARGAVNIPVCLRQVPARYCRLAVAATRSVGLPFGGVDLAPENDGVVFEVNVHPVLGHLPGVLDSVAIPYVRSHLPGD